ncbi:MAG TPA: DUF4124 domain-containing protein [Usitatibacter sp.]|nr:DUF4124 domain-containing protein [Usitatibacter sp.]
MKALAHAALLMATAVLAMPSAAAVLYKTVDEKGVIMFSDLPPTPGADAKRIMVPDATSAVPGAVHSADATAVETLTEERIRSGDEAVQRASLQVDMAEHALAVARRPLWDPSDLMKLEGPRLSAGDRDRLAYYRKNLKVAQSQLSDLLRTRRRAEANTMTAEAGMPIYGPRLPIYRR